VAAEWENRTSASTVRVETANTPAASTADEAPATSQIRSDDFEFALLEIRRFTIRQFYQFDTSASNCYQEIHEEILSKTAQIPSDFQLKLFYFYSLDDCSETDGIVTFLVPVG
jgi:hypothetical protein